jgi:hypothetical protein
LLSFSQQAKIATSLGLDALLAFLLAVNENEHDLPLYRRREVTARLVFECMCKE